MTAAGFGWRSAQIGSTAAYDDRQSISETVSVEQGAVERAVTVAANAREYDRYRADYAVAAALDREAARLDAVGAPRLAEVSRAEADDLREGATRRAATAGVFGDFTIDTDLLHPTKKPRPFDYRKRIRALAAEQSGELGSPASLAPATWANEATDIRVRIRGLTRWALLILVAVLLYAVAEVTSRRLLGYALIASGLVIYVAGAAGGLTTYFF